MSTIEIFEDRKDYKEFDGSVIDIKNLDDFRFPNPIDLWYDKPHYGRVNEQGDVIYIPQENFASQKKLTLIADGVYVIDFVAVAFEEFRLRIQNVVVLGGVMSAPTIGMESVFNSVRPKRGFQPVDELYDTYTDSYFDLFMKGYLRTTERDEHVKNFDDFMKYFMEFFNKFSGEMPITKTGFIKSNLCSPLVSGLVIETSLDNHNNDDAKGKYIDDSSFYFYHSLAKQYGFYVDKNAPWRLVANIASPQMQRYWIRTRGPTPGMGPMNIEYLDPEQFEEVCKDVVLPEKEPWSKSDYDNKIEKYLQPTSVNNFFETYYSESHKEDIEILKEKLIDSYNEYVTLYPKIIIEKDVSCATKIFLDAGNGVKPTNWRSTLSRKIIERKKVNIEETWPSWSLRKTVRSFEMYLSIRLKEENMEMPAAEFREAIKNAVRIYKHKDAKKTLDKRNAIRYINNTVKMHSDKIGKVLPFLIGESGLLLPPSAQEYENYVPQY